MIETYSLVVHEAALRGKLLVLNHDLPMMRELFGDNAIYLKFESDTVKRVYLDNDKKPDEQFYWNDHAKILVNAWLNNQALRGQINARRLWNPDVMWHQFEALLEMEPVGVELAYAN